MTRNSIALSVISPVADCHSDEYLLKLAYQPNATAEEIEAGLEALQRLEDKHRDALAVQDLLDREAKTAEVAKMEQVSKADAAIKKVEADIVQRFRDGLVKSGGQRVLNDSAKAKGLAARFGAAIVCSNFGGALAALKELRQGHIAAGMLHHFGSARAHNEFLLRADGQLQRLRTELPSKKQGKRRT